MDYELYLLTCLHWLDPWEIWNQFVYRESEGDDLAKHPELKISLFAGQRAAAHRLLCPSFSMSAGPLHYMWPPRSLAKIYKSFFISQLSFWNEALNTSYSLTSMFLMEIIQNIHQLLVVRSSHPTEVRRQIYYFCLWTDKLCTWKVANVDLNLTQRKYD